MYKVDFTFSKKGRMRFISHLDLMRLFARSLRRAELPVKITEGFNPHPKLSIAKALKLGVESDSELASVMMTESVRWDDFKNKMQAQLPEGIEILTVRVNVN